MDTSKLNKVISLILFEEEQYQFTTKITKLAQS